ncbi:MAG: hypothetical protein PUE61_08745 [Clostridiales bacterium]|nr:hypothetical protein [Clostridiales bacterium]
MDARSGWIWLSQGECVDQYGEFYDSFDFSEGRAMLRISADSNYAAYVNGELAYSGQYPDFPHYKIYDELDLTKYCRMGKNHLAIIVWFYGKGNMSYYPGRAALRYEIWQGERLCCHSSASTLSRQSRSYQNGRARNITSQMGFGFAYDCAREDAWMQGELAGFRESRAIAQNMPLLPRPVLGLERKAPIAETLLKNEGNTHFLMDLGREEAGFMMLEADSAEAQDVIIAYGEHIVDGGVRRKIGNRDFSAEIRLREGSNAYLNPFRRFGGRYLELFAERPLTLKRLTLVPVEYPVKQAENQPVMDELQKRIYDTAVRTLQLCMHEHYEDTPWREQALYAMDSRNQMLCGYYAFGEYAFARGNLLLFSKDNRRDGLLSICTPSKDDLTIPSFSLHYFTAVWEYTRYSGDLSLAREIWPKLESLMQVFTDRLENNLAPVFSESCHWNFYEWSEGLSGQLFHWDEKRFDAALNCLLSLALQAMDHLALALDRDSGYLALAEKINAAIRTQFFDEKRRIFVNSTEDDHGSELVNALAILCGASHGEEAKELAALLAQTDNGLTPATLSMRCFPYDALLKTDRARYAPWVIGDIDRRYEKMLAAGATSFWETEKGEQDFSRAGSLCHGWSAMPVYYYHLLLDHE